MHFSDDERVKLVFLVVRGSARVPCGKKDREEFHGGWWFSRGVVGPGWRIVGRCPVFVVAAIVAG